MTIIDCKAQPKKSVPQISWKLLFIILKICTRENAKQNYIQFQNKSSNIPNTILFICYLTFFGFRRLENNQITEIGPHAFQTASQLKRM